MPGLLRALVLAVVVVLLWGTRAAEAQAFRPRGKTPSTKSVKAKATAAPSKQPTRAAGPTPRRVVTTSPEVSPAPAKSKPKAKSKAKGKGKEDIVIVDDDDDDGVQIKDD
jgi:hypothetical protein